MLTFILIGIICIIIYKCIIKNPDNRRKLAKQAGQYMDSARSKLKELEK